MKAGVVGSGGIVMNKSDSFKEELLMKPQDDKQKELIKLSKKNLELKIELGEARKLLREIDTKTRRQP